MDDLYRSQFRLPWELYDQLKQKAESAGRSLNGEVVKRLENSLESDNFLGETVTDAAGQAAVLEVMLLVRQLNVVDLLELIDEIIPAIPAPVIESDPTLKSNLKHLSKSMKRLRISRERAERISKEYDEKFTAAVEHMVAHGGPTAEQAGKVGLELKNYFGTKRFLD